MKIVCVGRNYAAHIEELQNEKPKHPVLFLKPDTTILQKKQPFFIPHFSNDIHYEVEVLVKIQRLGKHIQPEFAHKYYSQIGLGIDFTARSVQNELKEKGTYTVTIYPIETKHITEFNKELLVKNDQLTKKNKEIMGLVH